MSVEPRITQSDRWLKRRGPEEHVIVSSRARYARNLPQMPFPMRARSEELMRVLERVGGAILSTSQFSDGMAFILSEMAAPERHYLKENHLISTEMEKGGSSRVLFLDPDVTMAVMVNEEDHLRLFCLETGFQPGIVLDRLIKLEALLEEHLEFAFSSRFGFLTACPTNTGTGLRASVLMHLPALASTNKLADEIKALPHLGLTARGPYGENSESVGDLFQISNEVTLGRTEEEIVSVLSGHVEKIIQREENARREILENNRLEVENEIWRAWGILTNARAMGSHEAVQLLSKLRLGIDRNYFHGLSHGELNRLVVQIQPAHLQIKDGSAINMSSRDAARADFLRSRLTRSGGPPAN